MTLSSAAYEAATAVSGDERRFSKSGPLHNNNYPEDKSSTRSKCRTNNSSKSEGKKKRFSLLRRLSSKKSNKDRESKTKKSKKRRFNPESSAPAIWPGSTSKAGRRRSSLQSDMSGHTWLSSGTYGDSCRSLVGQGDHLNKSGGRRDGSDRHAHEQEQGAAAAADNDDEPFQDSLGDLTAALPGLDLNHDSRSRLALRFAAGSDYANDGSHEDGTSTSDNDDDEMFRTAHGEENDMERATDDDDVDITDSFLSCIAETPEGGHGISPPSTSPQQQQQQQQHHHPDDAADTNTDGKPTARPIHQAQKEEQEQEADTTCAEVAKGPPTTATSTTTQRRKSVEFKDVVSYATVANKKFLSDDELFVLFYSVDEETELRHQLKAEIRAFKASPNPARTHPNFCRRGVEHYFLSREGRQARLASQHNVIDAVLDEQHVQYCERGEIHDESAIAIVSIEASRDARLDALERGGSDETEAILIRREDEEASAGTDIKQGGAVRLHRPTLDDSILQGKRRASDEGALCA